MNLCQVIGGYQMRIAELEERVHDLGGAPAAQPAATVRQALQDQREAPRPFFRRSTIGGASRASRIYDVVREHGGLEGLSPAEVASHFPDVPKHIVGVQLAQIGGLERVGAPRRWRYRVKP